MNAIHHRLIVLIVVVVSAVLALFAALDLRQTRERRLSELAQNIAALEQRLARTLPEALWAIDRALVRTLVDAEIGIGGLVGIDVFDDHATVIVAAGPAHAEQATAVHDLALTIVRDGQTLRVGELRVKVSDAAIRAELRGDLLRQLVMMVLLDLFLIGVLSLCIRRFILRPLDAVRDALVQVACEKADLSTRLPEDGSVEFASINREFNKFLARLERAVGGDVDQVRQAIGRIASGELGAPVPMTRATEPHSIMARLAQMQTTLQRMDADLRVALAQAEAATRAKSEFVARMSHEIRTPLNAVIGMSHLASRCDEDEEDKRREHLRGIEQAGHHLLGLVNDVLDDARISAGRMTLATTPFAMAAVLDNIASMFREQATARGLWLQLHLDPAVPTLLLGDPTRVAQMLINFVGNALKFTDQGGVTVHVTCLDSGWSRARLRLAVTDTGKGIDAATRARLFAAFEQASAMTGAEHGGSGLGLAITRELARLMGGDAGVISQLGEGSTFWAEIDLAMPHVRLHGPVGMPALGSRDGPAFAWRAGPRASSLQDRPDPPPPPPPDLRGRRILLVEDNVLNQRVAVGLLAETGATVDVAEDGPAALAMLARHRPDLVLMDMQMPGMDGLTLTRLLRSDPSLAGLPIVAMTANTQPEDRERCAQAGMDDFLAKPVVPKLFWSVLQRFLPVSHPVRPEKPVLDFTAGLRLLQGRQDTYDELLQAFADDQRDAAMQCARAVQSGDLAQAERIAHTLRGLAAQIGAERLRSTAQQVEKAVRQGQVDPQALARLDAALQEVVASLDARGKSSTAHGDPNRATSRPLRDQRVDTLLRRLAAADDPRALRLAQRQRASLHRRHGARAEPLIDHLRRCDFPAAQALLDAEHPIP